MGSGGRLVDAGHPPLQRGSDECRMITAGILACYGIIVQVLGFDDTLLKEGTF